MTDISFCWFISKVIV